MRYFQTWAVFLLGAFLLGCSPGLNWRDVRPAQAPLSALFPCKPEAAERRLPLGEKEIVVKMLVCEAEDTVFTLAYAELKPDLNPGDLLDLWRKSTLSQIKAKTPTQVPFTLKGTLSLPQSSRLIAQGTKPDGQPLAVHASWFAVGSVVFQAAVYFSDESSKANSAVADTFFSGLKIQ
jgi:hypothetical protein